jgi:excisionase family DNA binding protein
MRFLKPRMESRAGVFSRNLRTRRETMEKICIAKRRKKELVLPFPGLYSDETAGPARPCSERPYAVTRVRFLTEKGSLEDPVGDGDYRLSVELTPSRLAGQDAAGLIMSLAGIQKEEALFSRVEEDGRLVFNFQFKTAAPFSLLSGRQACRMLSVSRSFLARLVQTGGMRSFKIGRLRRFRLDDLLDYVSSSQAATAAGRGPESQT